MQDATPSIAIKNAIPATGYPQVEVRFCSPNEVSDEKQRAPVDGSCARAQLVNPKTGKVLGSDDE